jgi:predicted nucleotidyltransferase component of viral defense system
MKNASLDISTISVQDRLRHKARKSDRVFQDVLQHYGMERFLYRLSKTPYANYFILKGGLIFNTLDIPLRRPTKDIDLVCNTSKEDIAYIIKDTLSISVPEDCITFEPNTINIVEIHRDTDHHGLRVKFTGQLGKMVIPMQVDIGFSNEIASPPVNITYPTLLPEHNNPKVKGYPLEAIISEKFHAMVRFGTLNGRMKDYFDIWLLADNFEFETIALQKAIKTTFERRSTMLPSQRPSALTIEFAVANKQNWRSFLLRSKLLNNRLNEFNEIVDLIWIFLEFPLQKLVSGVRASKRHWSPRKGWYQIKGV